jgi:hypothetical protein
VLRSVRSSSVPKSMVFPSNEIVSASDVALDAALEVAPVVALDTALDAPSGFPFVRRCAG